MIRIAATMAIWIFAVFAAAGRADWYRGWIWVAVYVTSISIMVLLLQRANPTLLAARAKWRRKDTKRFDKVILSVVLPLTFLLPVIAGLDVVRFGWSSMPFATVYWGIVLFELSVALVVWAMMVNPFAESTVRIQSDRDQTVVTTGPYRYVRHPMYVGLIVMQPGLALIFGSVWALASTGVIAILLVVRTALEDRTLRRELPGYREFAAATRYRLVPGVW